jgi:hypothetical protein
MKAYQDEVFFEKMKQGIVYRRADLIKESSAADRYLESLVSKNKVLKVSPGLYLRPKTSAFGIVPPNEKDLIKSFLNDDRFLINSYTNYNQLGLGLTQLYNQQIVYNYKRYESVRLGNREYFFKRVPKFPKQLSKEFLLVDLFNNIKNLGEDERQVFLSLEKAKNNFDAAKVIKTSKAYGRKSTQKLMEKVFSEKNLLTRQK